jgi:hypothetical protein
VSRVDVDVNEKAGVEEPAGTDAVGSIRTKSNGSHSVERRDLPGPVSAPSATIGRIAAIRPALAPLVDFPSNTSGALVPARSLVSVTENDLGREVALVFEDGDSARPIIIGLMQSVNQPDAARPAQVTLDEDTLILSAKKEVVIRCGKASITLTNAGKVLIRGAYLLSRSSGVNRIKGGSVQIN